MPVGDSEERSTQVETLFAYIPQANIGNSSWMRARVRAENNGGIREFTMEKEQHAELAQLSGTPSYWTSNKQVILKLTLNLLPVLDEVDESECRTPP